MKRWSWFEGMGTVRRRIVNNGFQEVFSKINKGKGMHKYEIHVYALAWETGMSFVSTTRLLKSFG